MPQPLKSFTERVLEYVAHQPLPPELGEFCEHVWDWQEASEHRQASNVVEAVAFCQECGIMCSDCLASHEHDRRRDFSFGIGFDA